MKEIPVNKDHFITCKELDNFVKENEFDNPILQRIIHLTYDYTENYEKKSCFG